MDAQKRGDVSESKAYDALKWVQHTCPMMVRRVRRAAPAADARGIDFLIELNIVKGKKRGWMTVPIEVKSSMVGVRKWKMVHPEHHKAGVLIFVINHSLRSDELGWDFISALNKLRYNTRNGKLYVPWFLKLFKGKMSPRGEENIRKIKARRNKGKSKR